MSGRSKRGPGRPRIADSIHSLSPYPTSPLTPDSEETFLMSIREEGRSTRVRNRPKPQQTKKTRVNAHSKLKSPIKSSPIGSCTERNRDKHDYNPKHGNMMEMPSYSVQALDGLGQPLYDNLSSDGLGFAERTTRTEDNELAKSKVCSFCNCGVEMRMFHGELQRYAPTPGFNPSKKDQTNSGCDPFRDRLDIDPLDTGQYVDDPPEPQPVITRRGPGRPPGRGRRKGIVVVGLPLRSGNQELTVDKTTFGTTREKDLGDMFDEDGFTWAHHCCASWSEGVSQTDSYDLINVDQAVVKALSERCNHCNRFGASVVCQIPGCGKTYHYPCAASSGSFQDIKSMTMLCPDHLEDAGHLAGSEAECVLCGETKDFAAQIFCTSCGRHYHGRCLEPAVDLTSVIRMGWQCPDCKVCQGCRQPGDDNRMLVCDLCDTGYHMYCLDPPMSTIPKTGWKCLSCRRCEDCGSNTPGGGPTSRWHHNFSVCDSCYQQRNKGLFCPLCGRAYRQFTDVAMVQCLSCEKWIHASCDHIDREDYQKYNSKDLPYICPRCKPKKGSLQLLEKNDGIDLGIDNPVPDVDMSFDYQVEDKRTLTIAAESTSPCNMDEDLLLPSNLDDLNPLRHFDPVLDVTDTETIPIPSLDNIEPEKLSLGEKLPLDEEMEVVVKPDHELEMLATPDLPDTLPSFAVMDRHLSQPKAPVPNYYHHRNSYFTPPKVAGKRKFTGKIKTRASGTPARKKSKHGKPGRPPNKLKNKAPPQSSPGKENLPSTANIVDQPHQEEESESLHTTLVLFSADDEFTSKQDMCLCCGSFGKGTEGQLITCSQCGQSYHPYCVGVKINKVILTKGWRCLDCTLCEGCGKGSDEARLLLCDSCDISYHTYCLDPPLGHVPQGGWKCKWCVICVDCGATSPGVGCQWMSNYTQCGPCASKTTCPVCKIKYNTNDLMIQCAHCERWLHGSCDGLVNEEELDRAADYGYHCLYCRPKTKQTLVGVSGPPSPRATALHHYRPQSSQEIASLPSGKPLHPCQHRNNSFREVKLSVHYNKLQMSEPASGNSIELTESGMLHMNRLKLPPGGMRRRVIKTKVKPKKFGLPVSPIKKNNSFVGHMEDKDVVFNRALEGDGDNKLVRSLEHQAALFPSKLSRPRQSSGGRPGVGGFVLHGRGSGGRRFLGRGVRGSIKRKGSGFTHGPYMNSYGNQLSQETFSSGLNGSSVGSKQSSLSHLDSSVNQSSADTWADSSDENGLNDAFPKWMQEAFFGKELLDALGRDKRSRQGNKTPSTPSEDEDKAIQDPFAAQKGTAHQDQHVTFAGAGQVPYQMVSGEEQQHPQHPRQLLQQPGYPRGGHSTTQKHQSNLTLSGQEIWSQQPTGTDPFPSHALNLAEEVPNPDALYHSLDMLTDDLQNGAANDCHAANRGSSQLTSQQVPPAVTSQSHGVSSWNQTQPLPQGNDLDILDPEGILPHVGGQEVEEIFAGIEREMTNRVFNFLDSEIDNDVTNVQEQFPPPVSNPAASCSVSYQSNQHSVGTFGQNATNQAYNSGTSHFQGAPGVGRYQQAAQSHVDGFSNPSVSGQLGFGQSNVFPRPGEIDLDDFPRERRRPPSPRVDPQKQQQKWEEDEKLGAMATISPVLYANLEHVNLKQEYPDWTNRYRAIARLWRKLSVEQREPYRLKARDNRVKLKDQGKRTTGRNEDKSKAETQRLPNVNEQQQHPTPAQQQPQPQVSPPSQQPTQPALQSMQDSVLGHQRDQVSPLPALHPVVDNSNVAMTSVMPAPLTPSTPARSVTPGTPGALTPTTPTAPTFSHGQVLNPPQVGQGITAPLVNYPTSGKSVSSKGKKTKEEKEREKELRKQRLRIQQEQERQWKILQQKRALEQQRQQQQQQQENILLRKELKNQQLAKGTKGVEEQKKKRPSKCNKRASSQLSKDHGQCAEQAEVSCPSVQGENSNAPLSGAETRVQQPVLPVGASLSEAPIANANVLASSHAHFHNESSLEFLPRCDGQRNILTDVREGDGIAVNSSHEMHNLNPDNFHSVPGETSHQYQTTTVWQEEPMEKVTHPSGEGTWEHVQVHNQLELHNESDDHTLQALGPSRQNLWGPEDLQPEKMQNCLAPESIQDTTTLLDQHLRPNQEHPQTEQVSHSGMATHEQMFHDDRQQSWLRRPHSQPSGIQTPQPVVKGQQASIESGTMQPTISDSMQHVPFSSQQQIALNSSDKHQQEFQQASQQIPVMHWQEELTQVRAQVAAANDIHPPQSIAPPTAPAPAPPPPPPPPPLPPLPSSQQQPPASLQAYNVSTGWSQHGQVPAPPPPPPPPLVQAQPMVPFPQQPQKSAVPQVSFQPIQQSSSPMPPNQHPLLPMSTQSQENQMIQPQQQDLAQQQQREQLIRAQQQQFYQILQQQHVLQHQQQQQQQSAAAAAAIQPGFARPRFNPVISTKDLPEIDTEEEHQERLRFLYRQRQAQKQQQMHAQLVQQMWIQQQLANGGGQGVLPQAMLPVDPSNPQVQFATQQLRPQMPELAQQQLLAEYQRRMQQRQDLGQQTAQYNKVLQEFQQQQGTSGGVGTHTTGSFVEVPQQRFAIRQPTPLVQPGLKPIIPYGLDGQLVGQQQQQQLYNMQLQQQMMMLQQKSEPPQKNTSQASPALGKDATKVNSEASVNSDSESVHKSISPVQGAATRKSQCVSNTLMGESAQPFRKLEGESVTQQANIKGERFSEFPTEKTTLVHFEDEEFSEQSDDKDDLHISREKSGEVFESKSNNRARDAWSTQAIDANGKVCDEAQVKTTDVRDRKDQESISQTEVNAVGGLDNGMEDAEVLTRTKDSSSRGAEDAGCKEGASSDISCANDIKVGPELPSLKLKTEDVISNSNEERELPSSLNNQEVHCKVEEDNQINHVPVQSQLTTIQVQPGAQVQHFHQDINVTPKQESYQGMGQVPAQALHAPNQVPSVAPQPQQFLVLQQQQLLGLQQQFLQMEQQRQVLVQQYQQLQQRLQQAGGQDPVLASQVMAVQSQGQVLQQQMVQVHQQMQLLQQQFPMQQQQPQAQQWPLSMQNHPLGVQPGGLPARPALMGIQHPLPISDKEEKPKQRKSRTKSKETPPVGQQNQGQQTTKGKQTKPRQRKNKKSEANVDPDLEVKQQMFKQQIYRQMEQTHRLFQQKQGVFVEQGQQPIQQLPVPLNQHVADNPGMLPQPPLDVPQPGGPLTHAPELSQGPPSRPDSQISLPPGTSGPQVSLPSSTQIPPGYPQTNEQGSFCQRFPTPEHYLQQFGHHPMQPRQPTVQYVAEANNPFSDQFQGLQNKGRGRGGGRKKQGSKKQGRPPGKKAVDGATSDDPLQSPVNTVLQEAASPWPTQTPSPFVQSTQQEQVKAEEVVPEPPQVQNHARDSSDLSNVVTGDIREGSKESNNLLEQEATPRNGMSSEAQIEACSFNSSNEKSKFDEMSTEELKRDLAEKENAIVSPAPVEQESNESHEKDKGSCNGTGLEALQKLESMVADMANEEEACKELEKQNELERLQLQLDEDEFDPEMYEGNFMEDTTFDRSLFSPNKAVGNRSQANSVVSLECHEESLISPLLEETEKKKDRQTFFAETMRSDSSSLERNTLDKRGKPPASEPQGKEHPSATTSSTADPASTLSLYNVGNTNGGEPVTSVSNGYSAETGLNMPHKVSQGEILVDGIQHERQEAEDVVGNEPEGSTSAQITSKEQQGGIEKEKVEPFSGHIFESNEPKERPLRTAETPLIDPTVGCALQNGNDSISLAQNVGNAPYAPDVHNFRSSAGREGSQGFSNEAVPTLAGSIVVGSVYEKSNHLPEPLSNHQPAQVQETTTTIASSPGHPEKPVKTPKQPSRSKNQHSLTETPKKKVSTKEEDPLKKHMQELRRQEYERKKREYEEQQKKKRALQVKLRHEKQLIREQRKRQRIYMNANNRNKQKTEVRNSASSLKISTPSIPHKEVKPSAPLSLCEPKLLLTLALTHPYGSRPFSGQCLLKGNFGSAKVDGIVDYYSQFLMSDEDIVSVHPPTPPSSLPPSPGVPHRKTDSSGKPLVNGDVSLAERKPTEPLALTKAHSHDSEFPAKRARYMAGLDSSRGNVSVPPSIPTPPLSDSLTSGNDRIVAKQPSERRPDTNDKQSTDNSSSSSPETFQYIPSSSPESDAVNRLHTPKFSALLHRDITDSPTFPLVTIKREKVEHHLENGVSLSCAESCNSVSNTQLQQTNCKLEGYHVPGVGNDSDDFDSIHVTLTLSPTSQKRVTDTVASVADLIGCSPPRRSDIIIEPTCKPVVSTGYPVPMAGLTGEKLSGSIAPMAHTSTDIYQKSPFPCSQVGPSPSEENTSRTKPEGPYCRHCDVLIIGIGVKRKLENEERIEKTLSMEFNEAETSSEDYKIYRVNVEAGDCTGDIFCSDACLKQYFAHVGSACLSLTQDLKPEVNGLQPGMDGLLSSEGQTSLGVGNVTLLSESGARGSVMADGLPATSLRKIRSPSWKSEDQHDETKNCKRQRRLRWKRWQQSEAAMGDSKQRLELTSEEISELLEKHGALKAGFEIPHDKRLCTLCGEIGDGDNNVSARLLNLDVDVWVHLNCALWSLEVYETLNGALMNVDVAVKRGTTTNCVVCLKKGATVSCNQKIGLTKVGCPNNFHFTCAISRGCMFFKDKTMLCHEHRPESSSPMTELVLSSYAVYRKVFVNRNEIKQIASMLRHNQETGDKPQTLRLGSLVVKSLGQLLPHQLQSFHTRDAVYPVGFKTVRLYWSMHSVNRRCKYHCTVEDAEGIPSFTIRVDDVEQKDQLVFRGKTPRDAWQQILIPILNKRKEAGLIKLFPQYITGEDLFGLSEQFVLRVIESMPGVDQMQGYNMRYGPSPIMELPLAVNPTGSARSEPLLRTHFRSARARALRSATSSGPALSPAASVGAGNADESSSLYLKQFVYSKAAQYRKLKTEWKSNVFLGRSNIQGLGLFANKDMEGGSMVIEYIGSIIRNEVANRREQIYEKQNRGVYMFRIDSDAVIDATMAGGPARYINHSCSPNCVAEVVTFEKEQKIIIISNRKVEKGEELTYDYKFDFEDEENKIPCLCGAPNCRKWMN